MKKRVVGLITSLVVLSLFIYIKSQNPSDSVVQEAKEVAGAPQISRNELRGLLKNLIDRASELQKSMVGNQEGVIKKLLQLKRSGQGELGGFNQVNAAINRLVSQLKQIYNDSALMDQIQNSGELSMNLRQLARNSSAVAKPVSLAQTMQSANIFGRAMILYGLGKQLENVFKLAKDEYQARAKDKEKEREEAGFDGQVRTESAYRGDYTTYDDYSYSPPFEDYSSPMEDFSLSGDYDFGFSDFDLGY